MHTNSSLENDKVLDSLSTSSTESEAASLNSGAYNDNNVNKDSSLSSDDTPKEEAVKLNLNRKALPNDELEQPNNTPASSVSGPPKSAETSKKSSAVPNGGQFPPKAPFHGHFHPFIPFNPHICASHAGPRENVSNESPTIQINIEKLTIKSMTPGAYKPEGIITHIIGKMLSEVIINQKPEQVSPPAAAGQQQASQSSTTQADNQQPAPSDQKPAASAVSTSLSDTIAEALAQLTLNKS